MQLPGVTEVELNRYEAKLSIGLTNRGNGHHQQATSPRENGPHPKTKSDKVKREMMKKLLQPVCIANISFFFFFE